MLVNALLALGRRVGRACWCSWVDSAYGKKLGPQVWIGVIGPAPERGTRQRGNRSHTAHLGTEVVGFEIDGHPVRLQHRIQGIGDLLADTLLHRKAFGKKPHQPRQFRNADNVTAGEVLCYPLPPVPCSAC